MNNFTPRMTHVIACVIQGVIKKVIISFSLIKEFFLEKN